MKNRSLESARLYLPGRGLALDPDHVSAFSPADAAASLVKEAVEHVQRREESGLWHGAQLPSLMSAPAGSFSLCLPSFLLKQMWWP